MRSLTVAACLALISFTSAGYLTSGARAYGTRHGRNSVENYGPPQPYQFSYSTQDREGSQGHSQSSDGKTVRGHYMIHLADGSKRKVEYHADESGFHARIITNELGTESKNPADAIFQSSAISGVQAAQQYGTVLSSSRRRAAYAATKW